MVWSQNQRVTRHFPCSDQVAGCRERTSPDVPGVKISSVMGLWKNIGKVNSGKLQVSWMIAFFLFDGKK
jgi:hypothetical protein